jgi:hypothetical protein
MRIGTQGHPGNRMRGAHTHSVHTEKWRCIIVLVYFVLIIIILGVIIDLGGFTAYLIGAILTLAFLLLIYAHISTMRRQGARERRLLADNLELHQVGVLCHMSYVICHCHIIT